MPRWAALRWLIAIISLPPALVCLLSLTSWWWFVGELACHWGAHAAVALIPAMACWRRSAWMSGGIVALMLAGCAPLLIGAWQPRAPLPHQETAVMGTATPLIRVACANLFIYNQKELRSAAIQAALAQDADVLAISESVASDDRPLIDAVRWPHQMWVPQANRKWRDCIALLSRWPIIAQDIGARDTQPYLIATLAVHGRPLHVIAVHTQSLKLAREWQWRDAQLAEIASTVQRLVRERSAPVIVLGDHNVTTASPSWHRFAAAAQVQRPAGWQPATWPTWLGHAGITIDQITVRGLEAAPLRSFVIPGSDHRGLITDVAFPASGL